MDGEPQASPRLPSEEAVAPPEKDGSGADLRASPCSPVEAKLHPDVRIFAAVTGGRIPGLTQYQTVIDAVRFLRGWEKCDD